MRKRLREIYAVLCAAGIIWAWIMTTLVVAIFAIQYYATGRTKVTLDFDVVGEAKFEAVVFPLLSLFAAVWVVRILRGRKQ